MINSPAPVSKKALWTGYIMSAVPVLLFLTGVVMTVLSPPKMVESFTQFGFSESLLPKLGILELVCTILYVIPRTSVLGAILLTGYLGGATVTHIRVGQPFILPVIIGVLVWGGLFLRDQRVRDLIPLRR
jgi:hypothetical protein